MKELKRDREALLRMAKLFGRMPSPSRGNLRAEGSAFFGNVDGKSARFNYLDALDSAYHAAMAVGNSKLSRIKCVAVVPVGRTDQLNQVALDICGADFHHEGAEEKAYIAASLKAAVNQMGQHVSVHETCLRNWVSSGCLLKSLLRLVGAGAAPPPAPPPLPPPAPLPPPPAPPPPLPPPPLAIHALPPAHPPAVGGSAATAWRLLARNLAPPPPTLRGPAREGRRPPLQAPPPTHHSRHLSAHLSAPVAASPGDPAWGGPKDYTSIPKAAFGKSIALMSGGRAAGDGLVRLTLAHSGALYLLGLERHRGGGGVEFWDFRRDLNLAMSKLGHENFSQLELSTCLGKLASDEHGGISLVRSGSGPLFITLRRSPQSVSASAPQAHRKRPRSPTPLLPAAAKGSRSSVGPRPRSARPRSAALTRGPEESSQKTSVSSRPQSSLTRRKPASRKAASAPLPSRGAPASSANVAATVGRGSGALSATSDLRRLS